MGETGRDAAGEVVSAMRTHARVAVVGSGGTGLSTVVAGAMAALDRSWPVVQGLVSLRDEPLGAFAVAVGARQDDPAASVVDRVHRRAADGLVVEDVHHLDPASLDLLARLPRWVATCRGDAAGMLDRATPDVVVTVEPLPADVARAVVRDALGPVADRTVERVLSAAGGRHRLLREVTGRGAPRTTLRARLATILADQPDEVQEDLALMGAAAAAAAELHVAVVPTPRELCRDPAEAIARGLAHETGTGLLAEPLALALVAHELRPGSDARHRRLAAAATDALATAAHQLLVDEDPRAGLRAAGLLGGDPDAASLPARAAVLGRAADRHPDDVDLVTAAFEAALAVGDVAAARGLAEAVADGPGRLAAAIALHVDRPATAGQRRQDAIRQGAVGWRLEAEADLACEAVRVTGPSPAAAAHLLALLDDPLLDVSRVRVARALARTFAWLGRDADARRLLRYLATLSAIDPPTEAEVHWLAGRDHRAAATGDTVAGAWARVTGGAGAVIGGDDPETAALAWMQRDPRRAALAFMRGAHDSREACVDWRCRFGAVLALRAAGDPDAAGTVLAELERDLRDAHAVALLRRLGRPRAPAGTGNDHGDLLSPREREVLLLAGEGLSSREIATHLGITPATVETHVAAAMRKLRASTRLEAIARLAPA